MAKEVPKRFKFRSLKELNYRKPRSVTSSPIPLPSEESYTISSDEELENSMIKMEQNYTQESQ